MMQAVVAEFSPSQLPIVSGEVQCDKAAVRFASNGDWTFAGHLHDFSTFTGDNYALGFAFNYTDGGAHGPAVTGELGSSLTSLPESKTFGVSGNDPWIAEHWQLAFPGGGIFRLHTSDDLASALSDLGDDFKNIFHDVEVWFESGQDCPINEETGEPECPPPDPAPGEDGG